MTANVRIISPNAADLATLTASPAAVATLPVTNLQNQSRSSVWRSTSTAEQTIRGNFASAKSISALVLYQHNLTSAGRLELILFAGANQTGAVLYPNTWPTTILHPIVILDAWGRQFTVVWFPVETGVLSFMLVITDAANPDGYMEASRLTMGDYFEPGINMSRGLQCSWQTASKQHRTDGGTLRTDRFDPYRRWVIKLALLTETERAELFEIVRAVGMDQDFFISGFPEVGGATERDYAGLVKFTQMPPFVYMQADIEPSKFETDLVMEES